MEKGSKALVRMLLIALILGALVLCLHPQYRSAMKAAVEGQPRTSRIWLSNEAYYPHVAIRPSVKND